MKSAMSQKLTWTAAILMIGLSVFSQNAYASCGPRVIVTTSTLERALVVGKWQAKGRQHDRRSLFGLALRDRQAIELCGHEMRGKRHSLQQQIGRAA
jgi:hypothetical protein